MFGNCPIVLSYFVQSFSHFFLHASQIGVSVNISLCLAILSSVVSSVLMSSWKALFISVTVILISAFPFDSFLSSLLSAYIIYLLLHPVQFFFNRTLLIIVILNFQFDNFNMSAYSEFDSVTWFVSSGCGFSCLLVFLVIFLACQTYCAGKGNWGK